MRPVSDNEPWNLYGTCTQEGVEGWILLGCTSVLNSVVLLAAFYQAFKARNVDPSFSISRSLLFALFSWIQIIAIGLPLIFLVDKSNVSAAYFVEAGLILASCFTVILLIFARLWLEYRRTTQAQRGVMRATMFVPTARKPSARTTGDATSGHVAKQ